MSSSQSQLRAKRPPGGRKGPPRPTTARGPRAGLAISLLLHGGLLVATWITWQHMVEASQESHVVPVELVVAQQTNVRAEAPPQPPPPKLDIPKPTMEAPPLPEFRSAEPAPVPPMPQFKIAEPKTDADKPQDEPKTPPKKQSQDFAALLNKLAADQPPPRNAKAGPRVIQGVGNQSLATANLADELKSQMRQCWNPPVGAPNPADLVVDFAVMLNADGTVASRPLSDALASSNPYTRAAAEAAARAIVTCQPYHLPREQFSLWHEINPLRFDPRQMMNQ